METQLDSIAWTVFHPSIAFVVMVAIVAVCAVGAIAAYRDIGADRRRP